MGNFIFSNTLPNWLESGLDRKYQLEKQILVQEEPPSEILAAHLAACKSQNPDDRTDCQAEIKPGTPIWCQYAKPLPLEKRAFRHANLHNAILCGVDLSVDLSDVDLSVDLSDANLSRARLHGANLRNTKFQSVNLRRAELQDADLHSAKLQDAYLHSAKLQGANLYSAELHGADLRFAKLQGTNLYQAKLHGANLRKAELHGADLRKAELHGADLYQAKLHGADLRKAELHGADLRKAELHGADLRRVELHGADLRKAELHGADLRRAYLAGSDLSNANLNLADLRDVDLESKPDQEQLQKAIAIIKSITQQERRDQALELVKRAETEETTIASYSIEDAILNKYGILYTQLQESENWGLPQFPYFTQTRQFSYFTQTREDDYNTKLAAYLIDSLSCGDEDSYVAEEIIRSRIIRPPTILKGFAIYPFTQGLTFEIENKNLTSIFAKKLNLDSKVPILLCPGVEKHLDGLFEEERIQLRKIVAESANQ